MPGALDGTTVVDLSRVLGDPFCTQSLADHGADVIKIEPPQGDETRSWGPPFKDGLSAYFAGTNRNKRSMAVDLRQPAGRDIVLHLLKEADVLVHNFKIGALEKWGLGYDEVLKERFSGLIVCHITGFGPDGPFGGFPGYDAVLQAMTGLMSINGDPAQGPTRMGTPIVDIGTGLIACNAILAALIERSRSGLGQAIEVPLYDCAISLMHPQAANALMSGKVPVAAGNAHPNISPYDMYDTRTGKLYIAVGNNGQFVRLCEILNSRLMTCTIPALASSISLLAITGSLSGFARSSTCRTCQGMIGSPTMPRVANRPALTETLAARLADCDAHELEPTLLKAGVPAGVVRNVIEALEHPHTQHRGMVVDRGSFKGTGVPARLSRTPGEVCTAPPLFAQDSRQLLSEAGYSKVEIEDLILREIVQEATIS